ncbi:transcriptional regulator XRE family [Candidatus Termititenax persephonae]|uniref:Transcriptional regulator XRE family n=1 Tax=Candidatus Termititenax persephonae TaxID=2218525 RepID=A0A388TG01_9BACT|nr:transcriptional regulator XRE family [Candidatus Termititenax persephonae]
MQQSNIDQHFGRRLRELREKIPKSVNMFGYENDLTPATVSRIENGIHSPRLRTLKKIAEALGMSLSELLRGL